MTTKNYCSNSLTYCWARNLSKSPRTKEVVEQGEHEPNSSRWGKYFTYKTTLIFIYWHCFTLDSFISFQQFLQEVPYLDDPIIMDFSPYYFTNKKETISSILRNIMLALEIQESITYLLSFDGSMIMVWASFPAFFIWRSFEDNLRIFI